MRREIRRLPAALEGATRGEAAFGDDALPSERYVDSRARRDQIFGDTHERSSTAPSARVSVVIRNTGRKRRRDRRRRRARMCAAAVAAGRAIGYHNAGTVEFASTPRRVLLLEVNTRLRWSTR
jgi:acetyl/propionyl-CoA carboxylase alpha subunit